MNGEVKNATGHLRAAGQTLVDILVDVFIGFTPLQYSTLIVAEKLETGRSKLTTSWRLTAIPGLDTHSCFSFLLGAGLIHHEGRLPVKASSQSIPWRAGSRPRSGISTHITLSMHFGLIFSFNHRRI